MIADQESSILVECILGLTTRNLGATQVAVLFAAPKLSLELQLRLCNQNSISQPAMSAPNFHKRALLAKMMFSERASPDALSAWQRIDMLREEYLNIYSFGYAGFYLSVVDRILSHVTDIHVLEKCMQSLRGCELVGVASPLAISVVKQMFVLAPANSNKSKFEELTMLIVRYAKSSAEAVEIDDQDYRIGAKGHQHGIDSQSLSKYNFFTLLVLREYCDLLVEELGPLPTFYLLEKHKWFSVVSTRYLVGRAMEEQAHTSIGRYFHGKAVMFHKSNGPGAEFIRLIDDLVGSASAHKRTQAMYLMRHTRPTYGQKRVKIDSCFIRHLELLSKDPKVSKMDDFKGVYEATIGVNWPQYGRRRSPKKRDQSKKFS